MKLTKKILISILVICIIFSTIYFLVLRLIISSSIDEQKILGSKKLVIGAMAVLKNETTRIRFFCEDWAAWDSMYQYAVKPTRAFEKELAPQIMLRDADMSIFMVVNNQNDIVYLEGYHRMKRELMKLDRLRSKRGDIWKFARESVGSLYSKTGMVKSTQGPFLLVSSPILRSDNSGPPRGRVIMGNIIDRGTERRISSSIGETTHFILDSTKGEQSQGAFKLVKDLKLGHFRLEETDHHLIIRYPIKNAWKKQAFSLVIEAHKQIFDIFEQGTQLFFLLLITGFLIFGGLSYYIVHRMVVRRVTTISSITNNIESLDDLVDGIPESHNDEITLLTRNINKMLKRLHEENSKREEYEKIMLLNEKMVYLGKVISEISHEINNPLFAIAFSFQLLKKYIPAENDRVKEASQVLEREIDRVRLITRNMHKFTVQDIEESKHSDLSDIMDAAINVVKWSKKIQQTKIELLKIGEEFPLLCNPGSVQQVFMNIIVNAVEVMKGKGKLVIGLADSGKDYILDFKDTGPGVDESIINDLFKPFRTTKKGKGTGLGLNISQNIVANHGGSITVDNNYMQGARFIITIPKEGGLKHG